MDLVTILMWAAIGFIVAWLVEWFFWDKPTRDSVTRRFEEELTASRNDTEKLRVELRDARDRSATLERENGDVRAVLKAESDVRATAESKLLASDKKTVDLTAELARTRSELQAMTTRAAIIPTLEGSVAAWEQKHQAEASARATAEQLAKTQETRLRAQLSDWEARHKAEVGARAAAEEKALSLDRDLESLRAELDGATQKVALIPILQNNATDWEERHRREVVAREQAELKTGEVNTQLDKLRAQLGDWENRYRAETQARAAAEAHSGTLSLEIDTLRGQIDALQQQQQDAFTAADQQAVGLSAEIDKLRAQLEEWQGKHEAELATRTQAEARAETLGAELETMRGELTTVHERVAVIPTLQASAIDWEAKYQAEIAQRARYQQEIQAYEDELAQRGTRVSTLEAQIKQAADDLSSAERVSKDLEAERNSLREQVAAWESRLSSEATARAEADQKAGSLKSELDTLRAEVGSLNKRVTVIPTLESSASTWEQRYQGEVGLRTQLDTTVRERDTEIARLRERISVLETEHSTRTAALQSQLDIFGTQVKADNLEEINGIGKVFARKLNAAGVMTFEDLARTSIERIREIIQPKTWQKIEPEAWVIEASGRAGRPVGFAPAAAPDNLEEINGIGEVYARKLSDAGITTFAQLAAAAPERLREILQPEDWQKFEPEAWSAEAAEFARRGN